MLFNSFSFLLFFPLVVIVYFVLPKRVRWIWLLAGSLFFYMCWNPAYVLLLLTSIVITWASGLLIGGAPTVRRKKLYVALSFLLNLSILAFFKYANFLVDSLFAVLGAMDVTLARPVVDVLLPVGISFYTFQALSYTVDVYRGDIQVERNLFRYTLFVSFFPQLVAGPIERSRNLLRQVQKPRDFSYERLRSGLMLMLWGYFLKMVIADNAAVFVDNVYNHYAAHNGTVLLLATLLFAVQIYCDFCGYSAIAIGAAQAMGFDLCQNFRQPYLAVSVADFWRRWHISLTTWFRDYLYIPLGGNRCSKPRHYLNILITFLVIGLWHGSAWHYVVWGGLNGLFQIIGDCKNRLLRAALPNAKRTQTFSDLLAKRAVTFLLVCATWVFFRASTLESAVEILRRIFTQAAPWTLTNGALYTFGLTAVPFYALLISIGVLLAVDVLHEHGWDLRARLKRQRLWFRWLVYLLGIAAVLLLGVYGPAYQASAFIYFQF